MELAEKFPTILDLATEIDALEKKRDQILESDQGTCFLIFTRPGPNRLLEESFTTIELDADRIVDNMANFVVTKINARIDELKKLLYHKMYPTKHG